MKLRHTKPQTSWQKVSTHTEEKMREPVSHTGRLRRKGHSKGRQRDIHSHGAGRNSASQRDARVQSTSTYNTVTEEELVTTQHKTHRVGRPGLHRRRLKEGQHTGRSTERRREDGAEVEACKAGGTKVTTRLRRCDGLEPLEASAGKAKSAGRLVATRQLKTR